MFLSSINLVLLDVYVLRLPKNNKTVLDSEHHLKVDTPNNKTVLDSERPKINILTHTKKRIENRVELNTARRAFTE